MQLEHRRDATQDRRDTVLTTPYQALTHLLHLAQRAPVPENDIVLTGEDSVLPTNFLLGTAGVAVIAAGGVAVADLGYLRTRRRQRVAVDLDVELFGTVRHVTPAVQLSETPACWTSPTALFGTHEPVWAA
jgi:hypothetical protein